MDNCFWRRVARVALVFFAGLGLGVSPGAMEIYKSVDEQGGVQFSDKAPQRGGADGAEKIALEPDINTYQGVEVSVSDFLQTVQQAQEDAANNKKQPVVMYSAVWCGICKKARQYFQANNIPFREYDIEQSERGRQDYARLRARGVPIIFVGKQRMDGFSADRFRQLYPR